MPMFDYLCNKCGEKFEELIFSWDGKKDIACPLCSSEETERLIGAAVVITVSSSSGDSSSGCGCGSGNECPCA